MYNVTAESYMRIVTNNFQYIMFRVVTVEKITNFRALMFEQ